MIETNMFEEICDNQLEEIDGGSLTVAAAALILAGGVLVVSAIGSAFNGYQDTKRSNQ